MPVCMHRVHYVYNIKVEKFQTCSRTCPS